MGLRRWRFGQRGDGVPTYDEEGSYTVTLTVEDGNGGTASETLEINVGSPPVRVIDSPVDGATYDAGDTISFSGSATDEDDGELPASALGWTIVFHHDEHTHPFVGPIEDVTSGTFTIPTDGEVEDNVWYRIHLTVTDSSGLTHTTTTDIVPNKAEVTVDTEPSA